MSESERGLGAMEILNQAKIPRVDRYRVDDPVGALWARFASPELDQMLPERAREVYRVTIEPSASSGDVLVAALEVAGVSVEYARDLLVSEACHRRSDEPVGPIRLLVVPVSTMGLGEYPMIEAIDELQRALALPRAHPLDLVDLFLAAPDQVGPGTWLVSSMEPIPGHDGQPTFFCFNNSSEGPFLYCQWTKPQRNWNLWHQFVFRSPEQPT